MCGLAHFLEDEGLATVVVALIREHAVKMSPPRALWVPFELGRPFGTPLDASLQRRVLLAALALLDDPGPGPVLQDFGGEASDAGGDPGWTFPGELDSASVVDEVGSLLPLWEKAKARSNRTTVGLSGLAPAAAAEYVARYFSPDPMPNPGGMARLARARFAIDDIKALYFEAAFAGGGRPSSFQLNEWFWNQTLAGRTILEFQDTARRSEDKNLRMISGCLVPVERTYKYLQTA